MSTVSRTSNKKSRYGCIQCKRLRVKCDENKPSCDYCLRNKRSCQYLPVAPIKRREKKSKSDNDKVIVGASSRTYSSVSSGTSSATSNSPAEIKLDIANPYLLGSAPSTSASSIDSFFNIDAIPTDLIEYVDFDENGQHNLLDPVEFFPSSELPSLTTRNITPLSSLTSSQLKYLQYFYGEGLSIYSLGVPQLSNIWRNYGISVAIQSPSVLNGIIAYTGLLMKLKGIDISFTEYGAKEYAAENYFYSTVRNLRKSLSTNESHQTPVEMILSSSMVSACTFVDECDLPVLSFSGDVDLMSLSLGGRILIETYLPLSPPSFAKEFMSIGREHRLAACEVTKSGNIPESLKIEFLDYLSHTLEFDFVSRQLIVPTEAEFYRQCIEGIRNSGITSLVMRTYLPIMTVISEAPPEFRQACRSQRPFALIILLFTCVLLRRTVFKFRKFLCVWDKCIIETYSKLPKDLKYVGDVGLHMLKGLRFNDDIDKFAELLKNIQSGAFPDLSKQNSIFLDKV